MQYVVVFCDVSAIYQINLFHLDTAVVFYPIILGIK